MKIISSRNRAPLIVGEISMRTLMIWKPVVAALMIRKPGIAALLIWKRGVPGAPGDSALVYAAYTAYT